MSVSTALATSISVVAPIAVGIIGHRVARHADIDLDELSARSNAILAAIVAAMLDGRFRLVGCLAEGADTIVVNAALALGWQANLLVALSRIAHRSWQLTRR